MKTAYLGDGRKRQAFPVKTLLAAIAMLFMPAVAMAQPPAEAPPALPMEEAGVRHPNKLLYEELSEKCRSTTGSC